MGKFLLSKLVPWFYAMFNTKMKMGGMLTTPADITFKQKHSKKSWLGLGKDGLLQSPGCWSCVCLCLGCLDEMWILDTDKKWDVPSDPASSSLDAVNLTVYSYVSTAAESSLQVSFYNSTGCCICLPLLLIQYENGLPVDIFAIKEMHLSVKIK